MIAPKQRSAALFFAMTLLAVAPASADELSLLSPSSYLAQSMVDGNVLNSANGNIAVNLAAGDENMQLNAASLATSFGSGIAHAGVCGFQLTEKNGSSPDAAMCTIGGEAFANVSGLIAVNQASGQGNAQANGVAIAIGVEAVAENVLGAIVTGHEPVVADEKNGAPLRHASVDESAFKGARGVVQLNQLAGSGNATANSFAVRVSLGGVPD